MKKALGMIGVGVVAGVIVYALLDKTKNNKKEGQEAANSKDEFWKDVQKEKKYETEDIIGESENEFVKVKRTTADAMSARHEEAAKTMKEAVQIICKRSEVSEDENRELEQISEELDELLSEELKDE